ncbi:MULTISPECIES: arginine--tRNA ligase [Atopobiaceae]|uniref:Arginine--tRNA ligase n=1 Tax=Parafannyhessea umbonata TaxID=604330 RepID=A0A1H6K857_9ACTN|nr:MULTISPECIES: arginine--tRNA ligase [Atopobiaceae]SEH68635.1 arginyl-tRNA synthetase [Parafannyhessea umbonata]SJZ54254.1 arginyl-tRNA synthetase [Olsenella sp. KH1P3]
MPETIEELVKQAIAAAQSAGTLPEFEIEDCGIERPADTTNGDWSSTVAMRSARLAHMAPAKIAQAIVDNLPSDPSVAKVEVAGPGFINFYMSTSANNDVFREVRQKGDDWGRVNVGNGLRTQVEFVSANPTGPLHVGHGRWAALGDSLCNVLEFANFDIQREYYINDHGSQMDVFGRSVAMRYLQLGQIASEKGIDIDAAAQVLVEDRGNFVEDDADEHPETHPYMDAFNEALGGNSYGGDYIVDIAKEFWAHDGDKWMEADQQERDDEFRERSYRYMLARIKKTCDQSRCVFDEWRSERSFYVKDENGMSMVDRAFDTLRKEGYVYDDEEGVVWFKSTAFGDDKDRVLIKHNGEYTYFASDVAYCLDKFDRVDYEINIWGADHHGYIKRVQSVAEAFGYPGKYEILLGQFVNLLRNGEPVRMSKRKGTMISFQELLDEVGTDATRYTLISRSSNQTIDFDIEAVKQKSNANPVYYVQYAHARICSILRRAAGVTEDEALEMGMDAVAAKAIGEDYDLSLLTDPTEAALARKLSEFPDLIAGAARDRAPFRLTHFCEELAAAYHGFYAACQVLPSEGRPVDAGLSKARLAACDAVRINLEVALKLIGVTAPDVM